MPTGTDIRPTADKSTARRGARPAPADRAVEELEGALFGVARTILRLGIPAHALRQGEHIDRSAYWMLKRLDEAGDPLRLSDLAGLLELDLSTVSRQARQLTDAGMMDRVADPDDGRACRVSVSGRGREVLGAVRDARHETLRNAMGSWAPEERQALADALARLAGDMQGQAGGAA